MNLNKEILAREIAEENDISKVKARKIIDNIFNKMKESLVNGDTVRISTFGNFKKVERNKRMGYNPHTGSKIEIDASSSVKFKMATALESMLNKKDS